MKPHYEIVCEILEKIKSIILEERAATHGDFAQNHEAIAELWNAYLRACHGNRSPHLLPEDVAHLMLLMKLARTFNGRYNFDDYLDAAAYAIIAAALAENEARIIAAKENNLPEHD
jgi:hypothetical protein